MTIFSRSCISIRGCSIPRSECRCRFTRAGRCPAKVEIANARQQEAVAAYGAVALTSFREVENGLMNEGLLAQRLEFDRNVLQDRSEAVRIGRLKYDAGAIDLLSLLQLQTAQILSQVQVVKMRNARLTNRIDLHLALGGSFDRTPAVISFVSPADPRKTKS